MAFTCFNNAVTGCAHAGDKQLQSQWSAEPIQPGKRAPLPTIYSVIMCNCDPPPSLSVAFELLSALRSPQTSPVGLTLAFPAQHFPATPTDGLFQLITAVPCMGEPSRLHTHHSCLCCHSQLSQLLLIKFQFFFALKRLSGLSMINVQKYQTHQ